ncbi:uncharacterized protein SPSC_06051 [Sporisorium scitamineum]|uniref:EthD domain-containing protein n=1 Tax=Sporisorium scitamineum TaxID=49012 RepID=A0A0F7RUD1_9BASI|nr:hypothetical protein [Sporisorium scitamineum]CDU25880.1 uncharacterized protein SPSC_06051 [Sporisorium scitamineum]
MSTSESSSSPGKWTNGIKLSIYFKKKDALNDEQFSQYYANIHAALAGPVLLRHGCISYTQFHCMSDKARPSVATIFGPDALSPHNPMQVMPYDGCSSFVFASLQDAQGFFKDPETVSVLASDSLTFTDPATMQVTIGYELVAIHDGHAQHN